MSKTERLRKLVQMAKSLNESDQEKLVYIAEGMRMAQGTFERTPDTDQSA